MIVGQFQQTAVQSCDRFDNAQTEPDTWRSAAGVAAEETLYGF